MIATAPTRRIAQPQFRSRSREYAAGRFNGAAPRGARRSLFGKPLLLSVQDVGLRVVRMTTNF